MDVIRMHIGKYFYLFDLWHGFGVVGACRLESRMG